MLGLGGEMDFLLRRQQRPGADLVQVMLGGVGGEFGRQHFFQLVDALQDGAAAFDRHFAVRFHGIDRDFVDRLVRKFLRNRIVFQLVIRRACHGCLSSG
jgi:hypothetical protein